MLDYPILLTGATGFVGKALLAILAGNNVTVYGRSKPVNSSVKYVKGELASDTGFGNILQGIEIVTHIAARAHVMKENQEGCLEIYREVNTAATLNLAEQAAEAGVKRFIFISSIKVNGELTELGAPFKPTDNFVPTGPYGLSKFEAEVGLREIAKNTGMEVVIIRPTLVYGRGVRANFAAMMGLAKRNLPLPLGAINNKRSLVAIDNLVDLIVTCIDHPAAANQTFLVSDDHDVSTTELIETMTRAAGKRPWLLPVPMSVLKVASKLIGKQAIFDRLCGNLQVDISYTKQTLGWKPVITFEEGINQCFVEEPI